MIRILVLCMVVSSPVLAETITERDASGNPLRHFNTENGGSRLVERDNSGNPHGYWLKEGNSVVHRDNSGNFISRATTK